MLPDGVASWLQKEQCTFADGTAVDCWLLDWKYSANALDVWALQLRRRYIDDVDLRAMCSLLQTRPKSYIQSNVVPTTTQIRTGDFSEMLIADVLESLLNCAVPHYKHYGRVDRNSSEHGVDVLAYRLMASAPSKNDELLAIEVKSDVSGVTENRLLKRISDATTDSKKDPNRIPMTLNYTIMRASKAGDLKVASDLARFLDKGGGVDYKVTYGSAVTTSYNSPSAPIAKIEPHNVGLAKDSPLVIVHGDKLMSLVDALYNRMVQ